MGVRFRFDALNHEYIDLETGLVLPHTTGMLERTGWIDDTWYQTEHSERGRIVHSLTADYDLGAIENPRSVESPFKGYLLAHVTAMGIMRPTILGVEEPVVHPRYRYGTRPDRKVIYNAAKAILEIKSGLKHKAHPIQTALQAIALEEEFELEAHGILRLCLYIKANGKFKLEPHDDRRDIDEALRIIRRCAA